MISAVPPESIPITEKRFFVPSPAPRRLREAPLDLAEIAMLDSLVDTTVLEGPIKYNIHEVAERTGWSVDEIQKLWLWAGLVVPDMVDAVFTDDDVEGMRRLRLFRDSGELDEVSLSSMMRSIGTSMDRLAAWQVEDIVQNLIRHHDVSDSEARLEAISYAPAQAAALREQVHKIWGRHFAAAVHRLTSEALVRRGLTDRDQQFPLLCGIGVTTIVDFAAHTQNFGLAEYANFLSNFHDQISDIVNATGGRVIKTLGDAIMFVTPDAETGARIGLEIAKLHSQGFGAPTRTAFIWSRVMQYHGDLYGPGVNLATLLAGQMPANQLYVDEPTAAMLARQPAFELTEQPEIQVPGVGAIKPIAVTPLG